MTSPTPDRPGQPPLRGRPLLGLAGGLALASALAAVDLFAQPATAVVGFVILAPLLTSLFGTAREVAVVAVVAVLIAVLSGTWRHNFGAGVHVNRVLISTIVSLLATFTAHNRAQLHRDRERFSVLAQIADGTRTLQDTVAALNDLVVPVVADICVVDAISEGELQRLAVRAAADAGTGAMLAARPAGTADQLADPEQPFLMASVGDETLRQISTGDEDLARLRGLAIVTVPLRARGRRLGTLTLLTTTLSGRRYGALDVKIAKVLGGRAALALDNAGLYSELETIEAQLTAALSTLAEAVTVQQATGALIYANDAAARMLGFGSPQELLATPVEDVVARFETTTEDGSPVPDELPCRQVLAGTEPRPLVVRAVDRATGEETWRMTKASGVYDREGNVKLVVNVIEDITSVKRAELAQRLLVRAGDMLTSSLDYEHTLQQVAELAVPQLADWCAVSLPDGHGFVRAVAVAHVDPDRVRSRGASASATRRPPTRGPAPPRSCAPAPRSSSTRSPTRCSPAPPSTTSISSCCAPSACAPGSSSR